jgi:hypothetical protein
MMQKLIYADALRNECIELIRCIDAETVKEDYYDGMEGGVENVMKCIDDAPTIDAIPIEWIMRYAFDGKRKHPISITEMIADWRKEEK